ncbi:MAG: YcxB family protein [Alphaproteobacteria bacterium]|nr:YcxB family protein [Alphaproteobacteria bacterium]
MDRSFHTRFTLTLTLDDFSALSRAYVRLTPARRFGRFVSVFMTVLLVAGVGFSLWVLNDNALAVYFAALAVFLLLLQFVVTPWQRRRSFEHQRLGDFEVEMKADADGFTSSSELAQGHMKWASIRLVDDLPGHVILWPNNRLGWIVPKRAFATPVEADAFARLAKEKTAGQKL